MIELKHDRQALIYRPLSRAYGWSYPHILQEILWPAGFVYVALLVLSCGIIFQVGWPGVMLLLLLLVLPLIIDLIWILYLNWHLGRTSLLVSSAELIPGETLNFIFRQPFRQFLLIETLRIELVRHESQGGPDPTLQEDVIRTATDARRSVQPGKTYRIQDTFRLPHNAKPTESLPSSYGYSLSWLIRVTLKCKHVVTLVGEYPLAVIAGDMQP